MLDVRLLAAPPGLFRTSERGVVVRLKKITNKNIRRGGGMHIYPLLLQELTKVPVSEGGTFKIHENGSCLICGCTPEEGVGTYCPGKQAKS